MHQAVQQSQRATKLEGLLDRVKTRVQDLEDRYLSKAVQQHTQQLQKDKQETRVCQKISTTTNESLQCVVVYGGIYEQDKPLVACVSRFR